MPLSRISIKFAMTMIVQLKYLEIYLLPEAKQEVLKSSHDRSINFFIFLNKFTKLTHINFPRGDLHLLFFYSIHLFIFCP